MQQPGLSSTISSFNRQVNAQCLECHSTYAKAERIQTKKLYLQTMQVMYGIECERCHGPAAEHVAYFTAHPQDTVSKYIIAIKYLSRQQKLRCLRALPFRVKKRKTTSLFLLQLVINWMIFQRLIIMQIQLPCLMYMATSMDCLLQVNVSAMSQMDCSSCHNVHVNEAGNKQVFSQRCMNCHNATNA